MLGNDLLVIYCMVAAEIGGGAIVIVSNLLKLALRMKRLQNKPSGQLLHNEGRKTRKNWLKVKLSVKA